MRQKIQVFKFGGSALRDVDGINRVVEILKGHRDEKLFIVVSAMGKTTDRLEEVVESYVSREQGKAMQLLDEIRNWHYEVMSAFFEPTSEVYAQVNDSFVEIEWVIEEEPQDNYDYLYDQIVSIGELVSSKIIAALLNIEGLPTHWLDARDVILTDNIFREGWVQWEETVTRCDDHVRPLLAKEGFILTQGFIGSTTENFTTTLGREGSDYTAAIFSYCLDAESMTIWKDVSGVMTGDPRLFENVLKLDRLSYREAIEMTYYGAKVLHPKTIKPLQNKSIPLYVKSFLDPTASGTFISSEVDDHYPPIVTIEQDQALVNISTRDFSFVAEHHMSQLFSIIADLRLQVNMMQNTAISFVVCFNDIDDKVDRFVELVKKEFKVNVDRDLELITVRHALPTILENLKAGKILLLEERIGQTVQMVVKNVPIMNRKEVEQEQVNEA